ncbi:MAG TPA: hypothetical protein VGR70_09935 [Stellaceae bacterium]|nr:hypothetical protein [Stellaceae bacterium]
MAALQSAADRSQLTLSSEVADRLIRSLSNDYGIPLEFEHSENRGFSGMIVTWERRLRQQTGRSWADDAYTFRAFAAGIVELLQLLPGRLGIADGEPVVPLRLRQIYSAAARPAAASDEPTAVPSPEDLGRGLMIELFNLLPKYAGPEAAVHHATGFHREYPELLQINRDLGLGNSG